MLNWEIEYKVSGDSYWMKKSYLKGVMLLESGNSCWGGISGGVNQMVDILNLSAKPDLSIRCCRASLESQKKV